MSSPQITQIQIPTLVRMKAGALARLGIYLRRAGFQRVVVLYSEGLPASILELLRTGFREEKREIALLASVPDASFEAAQELFAELPSGIQAIVGLGGGKALDVAKYVSHLSALPYYAAPASLSNDGFCSPQSSLTLKGKRRSLAAALPYGVVVDTEVCLNAPKILWLSGVGDLVAKLTAIADWKLAFHAEGQPVNDLAALMSDATVYQFLAEPEHSAEGIQLLGTALMLNGVAMEITGSSRPASGSEHLISHALDRLSAAPKLHGIQVGVATYLIALLQGQLRAAERIDGVFTKTGFWDAVAAEPFRREEWMEAMRLAPSIKQGFYCVLSSRDCTGEAERLIANDPRLRHSIV